MGMLSSHLYVPLTFFKVAWMERNAIRRSCHVVVSLSCGKVNVAGAREKVGCLALSVIYNLKSCTPATSTSNFYQQLVSYYLGAVRSHHLIINFKLQRLHQFYTKASIYHGDSR